MQQVKQVDRDEKYLCPPHNFPVRIGNFSFGEKLPAFYDSATNTIILITKLERRPSDRCGQSYMDVHGINWSDGSNIFLKLATDAWITTVNLEEQIYSGKNIYPTTLYDDAPKFKDTNGDVCIPWASSALLEECRRKMDTERRRNTDATSLSIKLTVARIWNTQKIVDYSFCFKMK